MRTVHKYYLHSDGFITIPEGAKLLHVGLQKDTPYVWAEVFTDNEPVERGVEIFGTGQELPAVAEHVGTFMQEGFVWHVYDLGEL